VADNSQQIMEWNGAMGQRWATMQREIDGIVVPFGDAALKVASPQAGERVVDVGCGCGDTSIEIARTVGTAGAVLGVDVSQPMLDVARSRGELAELANLSFCEGDASNVALPPNTDLLYSRFGVMFFSDPPQAFAHMRKALRAQGRCVFVCWRTPRENSWATTPLSAARAAMGATPAPGDPNAPGPFAFADDQRVRDILTKAGFDAISMTRFDAPVFLGATPRAAAENAARIGPVSRFVRETGIEHLPVVLAALEKTFVPLAASDGRIALNGSTWIVSATNPV